jgi:hypothetical protein
VNEPSDSELVRVARGGDATTVSAAKVQLQKTAIIVVG